MLPLTVSRIGSGAGSFGGVAVGGAVAVAGVALGGAGAITGRAAADDTGGGAAGAAIGAGVLGGVAFAVGTTAGVDMAPAIAGGGPGFEADTEAEAAVVPDGLGTVGARGARTMGGQGLSDIVDVSATGGVVGLGVATGAAADGESVFGFSGGGVFSAAGCGFGSGAAAVPGPVTRIVTT